jgi:ERCC4-type nuclease
MSMEPFYVSPTEPPELRAVGVVSSLPDVHGCDVVWTGPAGLVGVQRKTLADLASSLRDGRLTEAAARMALLDVRVLLVEGRPRWSSASDRLLDVPLPITRDGLRGVLWSAQQRGLWVCTTASLLETVDVVVHLRRWLAKRRHASFDRRPAPPALVGSRAWGAHLLQSFPTVGPVVAGQIWDHFGAVPLRWSCTREELAAVRGIGPGRASTLWSALPAVAHPNRTRCAAGSAPDDRSIAAPADASKGTLDR